MRIDIGEIRLAYVALALAAFALIAAGCAADDPEDGGVAQLTVNGDATVVVANSPGTLTTNGPQRVLVGLIGSGPNDFLGGDDQRAVLEFEAVEGEGRGEATGAWLSNPGVELGLYTATFTFDEPGLWQISIKGTGDNVSGALVEVGEDAVIPGLGEPAPPSETLTGSTADELEAISTDPEPDPDLYDLTVADALGNGRPSVIVFATPAFCRTAICGPTVEIIKDVAADHDDVDFVHVEPFDVALARAGTLQPIDAMFEWGLATEPWVFVTDEDGIVTAALEGIISEAELERNLADLS